MNDKPKRRWYQFSLRTFLVVMVVASAGFGYWVHWAKDWIRQRPVALDAGGLSWGSDDPPVVAPGGLWLLGEVGINYMRVRPSSGRSLHDWRELFPEAKIDGRFYPQEEIEPPP
jgi:hypothetical protein